MRNSVTLQSHHRETSWTQGSCAVSESCPMMHQVILVRVTSSSVSSYPVSMLFLAKARTRLATWRHLTCILYRRSKVDRTTCKSKIRKKWDWSNVSLVRNRRFFYHRCYDSISTFTLLKIYQTRETGFLQISKHLAFLKNTSAFASYFQLSFSVENITKPCHSWVVYYLKKLVKFWLFWNLDAVTLNFMHSLFLSLLPFRDFCLILWQTRTSITGSLLPQLLYRKIWRDKNKQTK